MTPTKPKREEKPPSQATALVELAESSGLGFVLTPEGEPFVVVPMERHCETKPLRGRGFGAWLRGRYFETTGKAANAQAISDAIGVLEMKALRGKRAPVHVRVASETDGLLYLDLGGADWRVVEVTAGGWSVIEGAHAPVYFRRPAGLLELPAPERGGSLEELRPFVNVASEADWRLLAGWLVAALRGAGPYPVLVLLGEQGCAKSTTARHLRRCIDANKAELRSEPRSEEDLILAATNGWAVTLDNVSSLQPWLSDALCRISTGGGLGKRALYTDDEEKLFDVQRPLILNGIGDIVSRPDLLDRAFLVTCPRLEASKHRREAELRRDFAEAHPRILGALLDAVSLAIREEESTAETLGPLPRMADAACWIEAAAPALGWQPRAFLAAYRGNRDDAHALALESSPVAAAVQGLLEARFGAVEGTASDLLEALAEHASEAVRRSKLWPSSPRALSTALQRLAPTLRAVGVSVDQVRHGKAGARLWILSHAKESRDLRQHRQHRQPVSDFADLQADANAGRLTQTPPADANAGAAAIHRQPLTPRYFKGADEADATDANAGALSQEPLSYEGGYLDGLEEGEAW